jgi:hypothetical protein
MTGKRKQAKAPADAGAASDWMDASECGVRFRTPDARYAEIQRDNKAWLLTVADAIENGAALDAVERKIAAAVLRSASERMPIEQRKSVGQAPQWDHGSEALVFVGLRVQGLSPTKAYASIADRVGVSEQAVQKAMRQHAPGAARLLSESFGMDVPPYLFRE